MAAGRPSDLPIIMCVCRHNSGRSQIAAAYLRAFLNGRARVMSAGTEPADAVNPIVVAAMREDGYDLSHAMPMRVHPNTVSAADYVITMGCDVQGVARIDEDWDLPDPAGESIETIREIRDRIKAKAKGFAGRFRPLEPSREG